MLGADTADKLLWGFHKGLMLMNASFSSLVTQVTHVLGEEMDTSQRSVAVLILPEPALWPASPDEAA